MTKSYDKIKKVATGQGDNYTTGCVLDYLYFKENYNLIAIDLSKQQASDLQRKTKRNCFTNLNIKDITDSKYQRKRLSQILMRKVPVVVKLYFQKKGSILNDNKEICNTMSNYFINITKTLNLKPYNKCSIL